MSAGRPHVIVLSDLVAEVGGASKAARLLCERLAAMGVRVILYVTGRPDQAVQASLERQGIAVRVPVVDKGWRMALPSRALALQLAFALRRDPPNLVIAVGLTQLTKSLLALQPPVPVWAWETTEALPHVKFVDVTIAPHLVAAAGLLVPSRTVAENARKTYGYEGRILTLPFWVDAPPLVPEPALDSQTFLFLGRLDADKGLGTLFEAFRKVLVERPTAKLIVCGGGDAEALRAQVRDTPAIEVRGFVDDAQLEAAFHDSTALVLPSFHEGYPLTLLEACARGRPVIATAVGSIPVVYGARLCATVVPPRDVSALADAMLRTLAEPADRRVACSRDALSLFEEVSSTQAIERALRSIIETSGEAGVAGVGDRHLRATLARSMKGTRVGMALKRGIDRIRDVPRAREVRRLVRVAAWEKPPCAVCGGRAVRPHHRYNGFDIVRCPDDGLLFVSPRPVDTAPYYDGRYYTDPDVGYRGYASHAERSRAEWSERLDELAASSPQQGRLLDVGCASGEFLEQARERGWQVRGIELSQWAVEQARTVRSLDVLQGSLPDARFDARTFEAVTFFDCVEHVREPAAVLRDIRRVLVPGGVLLLSTGALRHEDPLLESHWYYPPWHLYYFSESTMTALLARAGFELVRYFEKEGLMIVLAKAIAPGNVT